MWYRKVLFSFLAILATSSLTFLAACGGGGGGGGGDSPGTPVAGKVSGVGVKGAFSTGTAEAFSVNSNGSINQLLGSAMLDATGAFTIDVGMHTGPLIVRLSGGTFNNEATGQVVNQTNAMHCIVGTFTLASSIQINVTPLTEIVTQQIQTNAGGGMALATSVSRAYSLTQEYFGVTDILNERPIDLSQGSATSASTSVRAYSAILAGIAQLAFSLNVAPDELVAALALDARDEVFDGMNAGNSISLGAGVLANDAARNALSTAMAGFLNGAQNLSGLVQNDLQVSLDAIANNPSGIVHVTSISVAPTSADLRIGETQALTVSAVRNDGSQITLANNEVAFDSLASNIASVDASGIVAAHAIGTTTITATYDGNLSSMMMVMVDNPLVQIAISPLDVSIADGLTQQYSAIGTFFDNTMMDISSMVTWASSNQAIATISNTGLATSVFPGSTNITATDPATLVNASTTLTINAVLVSLSISPMAPSVPAGMTVQLTATGHFSDNTTQNFTNDVSWESNATNFATVSTSGLLAGILEGSAQITATYMVDNNFSAMVTATVTKEVASLAISPTSLTLADNDTSQLAVQATFTDNSMATFTQSASWTSNNNTIASVSASGLVSANFPGTTTIRATDLASGVFDQIQVTVTAILVSITVTPANPMVNHQATQQFTATATFSDNTMMSLQSPLVTWSSTNMLVAPISPSGLASAPQPGTSTIIATSTVNSAISGSTLMTVVATLSSVTISPLNPTILSNQTQQFQLTAHFSDASMSNVTSPGTFLSTNMSAATINNSGLATGVAAGQTTISGTYMGMSAQTTLTLNAAPISFANDILQIFAANSCTSHHAGSFPDGGLNLTSYAGVIAGGNNGAAVVMAGNGANSLLYRVLNGPVTNAPIVPNIAQMPKALGAMAQASRDKIKLWIDQGAQNN